MIFDSISKSCICPNGYLWNGYLCMSTCQNGQVWNTISGKCQCPLNLIYNGYSCI